MKLSSDNIHAFRTSVGALGQNGPPISFIIIAPLCMNTLGTLCFILACPKIGSKSIPFRMLCIRGLHVRLRALVNQFFNCKLDSPVWAWSSFFSFGVG